MHLLRSTVAVLAGLGFMLSAVMIGTGLVGSLLLPAGLLGAYVAVSLGISFLAAMFGGWLAARIGGGAEMAHAGALAALLATMTVLVIAGDRPVQQPVWYAPTVGVLGVAGVLAGGWLRGAAAHAARP